MTRLAILAAGVGAGILGAILPVLPTTPFLILPAWLSLESPRSEIDRLFEEFASTFRGRQRCPNPVPGAPPRVLDIRRKRLNPAIHVSATAEVAKDLVKFPIPGIERYLSE